jgi:cellulose biosynthesis protein BcsQ
MFHAIEFLKQVHSLNLQEQLWGPISVIAAIMALIGFWFGRRFPRSDIAAFGLENIGPSARELLLQRQLDEARAREANDTKMRDAILSNESELWQLYEPRPRVRYSSPSDASRPKILVIANNKGGVGKTTLTAGLATYFERRQQKRVLLIDLDYQGSLTNWMIKAADIHIPPDQAYRLAHANGLVDGEARELWGAESLRNDKSAEGFAHAQLITADYTLTQHETKLMLNWLLQGGVPDIRFYIGEALLGRRVQDQEKGFDIVIIDTPPRLTTGTVGALIAATHLIVPTILDPLSAETVGSFLKQAWALRQRFNPGLELAGVVGTMTTARPLGKPLTAAELDVRGLVLSRMAEWKTNAFMFNADIQDIARIRRRAGVLNPYFSEDDRVPQMFDALGDELWHRMETSKATEEDTGPRPVLRAGAVR